MATLYRISTCFLLVFFSFHPACDGQTRLRPDTTDALRNRIIAIAKKEVGVLEKTGKNDHPRILVYHKSVSNYLFLARPVNPYCASYVNYCYKTAGAKITKVPNPARARDYFLVPGRIVLTQQLLRGNRRMIKWPKPGDVIGYYYIKSGAISHIEIFFCIDPKDPNYYFALAANTSNKSSVTTIDRDGQGVFLVRRNMKSFYKIANIIDL